MIQHLGRTVRGTRAFYIFRDRTDPGQPQIVACHPPLSDEALLRCLEAHDVVCTPVSEDDSHQAWVGIASDTSIANQELAHEMTSVVAHSIAMDLRSLALEGVPGGSRDRETGLLDRDAFTVRVGQAIDALSADSTTQVAILVVDIDRFQRVAARFGDVGEVEGITQLSTRLSAVATGDGVTLARIGNDRFGVLLQGPGAQAAAGALAAGFHECLETPLLLADELIFVTASIGVATATPGMRPGMLIQRADLAITELLAKGGSATLAFRDGMQSEPAQQLLRERDVRLAVARHEFTIHFQPIVGAMHGGLHAFEALLRWRNPEEGLLPPSMFLDVLNETGLIASVGQRVIEEACAHSARWMALCGSLVPVSVNIVPAQLYSEGFCDFVAQTLTDAGLPPTGLLLELTEEALIHDALKAHDILEALKTLGVRVMIDDFGTGYSSLAYLHDLPVSGLKLDRNFLREIDHSAKQREIVRSIVRLAHYMGMVVVAEGIETADQWSAVRDLDCDLAQGFRFARPLDAENATRYLTRDLARGEAA